MKVLQLKDKKPPLISVSFQFLSLNRLVRLKVNSKTTTLKSLRPVLAEKFQIDSTHIRLRFTAKTPKKEALDQDTPLEMLGYFGVEMEVYKVEVDLEYQGG